MKGNIRKQLVLGLSLLVLVSGTHRWQPCKPQCDANFSTNDVAKKPSLIAACQKGCDLYTMSLIFSPLRKKTNVVSTSIESPEKNMHNSIPMPEFHESLMENNIFNDVYSTNNIGFDKKPFFVGNPMENSHLFEIHERPMTKVSKNIIESDNQKIIQISKTSPMGKEFIIIKESSSNPMHIKNEKENVMFDPFSRFFSKVELHRQNIDFNGPPILSNNPDVFIPLNPNKLQPINNAAPHGFPNAVRERLEMPFWAMLLNPVNQLSSPKQEHVIAIKNKSTVNVKNEKPKKEKENKSKKFVLDFNGEPLISVDFSEKENNEKHNNKPAVKVNKMPKEEENNIIKTEEHVKAEKKNEVVKPSTKTETPDHHKVKREIPGIMLVFHGASHHQSSSSKTTVQPTPHPVQDHPMSAHKQATTNTPDDQKKLAHKPITKSENAMTNEEDEEMEKMRKLANQLSSENDDIHLLTKTKLSSSDALKEPETINSLNERYEQAKHSCRHACVKTYGTGVLQEACVVGCQLQATTVGLLRTPQKEVEPEPSFFPKSPLSALQQAMFSLAGHVGHLIRVTWSWASSAASQNDHTQKLQEPASKPMPVYENKQEANRLKKLPLIVKPGMNNDKFVLEGFPNLQMATYIKVAGEDYLKRNKDLITATNRHHHHHHDQKQVATDNQNGQHLDLLECISRKSGLPRWFIAPTIFASSLVVLWLCFSLTAPPEDIKVLKTKPPEMEGAEEDDEYDDDDDLTCAEKKTLLARADDVIKIRIENV